MQNGSLDSASRFSVWNTGIMKTYELNKLEKDWDETIETFKEQNLENKAMNLEELESGHSWH